jgi:hypothetical protein
MKICPNCKNKENENVCSACGTKMRSTVATKIGVAVRLTIFGVMVLLSVVATVLSIPELFADGFFSGISYGMLLFGVLMTTALSMMLLVKWALFILPKSFRWANSFAKNLVAFSLFGLALKLMLWLSAILFPFGIACSLTSSLLLGIASMLMTMGGSNFILSALLVLAVVAVAAIYVLFEIKKWGAWSFRDLFSGFKKRNAVA